MTKITNTTRSSITMSVKDKAGNVESLALEPGAETAVPDGFTIVETPMHKGRVQAGELTIDGATASDDAASTDTTSKKETK